MDEQEKNILAMIEQAEILLAQAENAQKSFFQFKTQTEEYMTRTQRAIQDSINGLPSTARATVTAYMQEVTHGTAEAAKELEKTIQSYTSKVAEAANRAQADLQPFRWQWLWSALFLFLSSAP